MVLAWLASMPHSFLVSSNVFKSAYDLRPAFFCQVQLVLAYMPLSRMLGTWLAWYSSHRSLNLAGRAAVLPNHCASEGIRCWAVAPSGAPLAPQLASALSLAASQATGAHAEHISLKHMHAMSALVSSSVSLDVMMDTCGGCCFNLCP